MIDRRDRPLIALPENSGQPLAGRDHGDHIALERHAGREDDEAASDPMESILDMDGNIDLLTFIILVVALIVIFRLRSVLGRRTGDEEGRIERYRQARAQAEDPSSDKVVTLPRRDGREHAAEPESGVSVAEAQERIKTLGLSDKNVEKGLLDILRADPNFDPEGFLRGAKQAYEMIVTAFAEGNRRILRDLLSSEVYDGFSAAISDREDRGEQIDQSFVGIEKASIVEADVSKEGIASVTVRFVSQLISATLDRSGNVVDGDTQRITEVTDIWTFIRDVSTESARSNLNWRLDATQSPS